MSIAFKQHPAKHAVIDLRSVPGFVPNDRCAGGSLSPQTCGVSLFEK